MCFPGSAECPSLPTFLATLPTLPGQHGPLPLLGAAPLFSSAIGPNGLWPCAWTSHRSQGTALGEPCPAVAPAVESPLAQASPAILLLCTRTQDCVRGHSPHVFISTHADVSQAELAVNQLRELESCPGTSFPTPSRSVKAALTLPAAARC